MPTFDYQAYLASREWALKREAVRERSGNRCERYIGAYRCPSPHESTHHITYANIGNEPLDDLMAVCNNCHRWLSGKTDVDPLICLVNRPRKPRTDCSLAEFLRICDLCGEDSEDGYYVSHESFSHHICGACKQGLEKQDKLSWDVVDALHVMLVVRRYLDEQVTL